MDDKLNIKDRILKDVGKSIKLIQQLSVGIGTSESFIPGGECGVGYVNSNSWLVQSLCCHIDLAFRHGLREPLHGFWPLLHDLSHSDAFHIIDGHQNVNSPLGKGLLWLHHTLMEGSLQCYLQCLIRDTRTLRRYYSSKAILRDTSCTQQLLTLLAGLENISFNMSAERGDLQEATGFSGLTSMTSSLSSPVDSGVALLDSDADVTSTYEATVTEGDAISLKEDEGVLAELEDNRINDNIVSKGSRNAELFCSVSNFGNETNDDKLGNEDRMLLNNKTCYDVTPEFSSHISNKDTENLTLSFGSASEMDGNIEPFGMVNEVVAMTIPVELSNILSKSSILTKSSKSNISVSPGNNGMTESCSYFGEKSYRSHDPMVNDEWRNDVLSNSVGGETPVVRRQRKTKRNDPDMKVKRVSFHEDLLNQSTDSVSVFSASFLPPNPVIKCDVVKGRYSWCAEGDSPYFEQRKSNDTRSDVFLSGSIDVIEKINDSVNSEVLKCKELENKLCSETGDSLIDIAKVSSCKSVISDTKLPPVTERGMPEGQEDPPKTSSLLHLNSITDSVLKKFPSISSSIDWSSDTDCDVCDHHLSKTGGLPFRKEDRRISSKCQSALLKFSSFMSPSKTSLLKRFMKSVTEKKCSRKKNKLQKFKSLYIPGAKPDPMAAGQYISELETIYAQMNDLTRNETTVGDMFKKALKDSIFQDSMEDVYKVFKVYSSYLVEGQSEPLVIVLSSKAIYFIGLKRNFSCYLYLMINYTELESIIVGPSRQTLFFTTHHHKKQVFVVSGNVTTTGDVVSHVEVAMRKLTSKPILPVVQELQLENMKTLKLQLSKNSMLLDDEELCHYSIVHLQDNPTSPPSTPLGPEKEGHLMFRPATGPPLQPWEAGYFILKGGVVYMFSDVESRLPKRVIPLHGGQCQGCRRITHESRPYTFEIILGHKRSFQFAAADEYETSDWLQALVQAASGFYEMEQVNTLFCSLIMTSGHIIACQENFSSGAVSILTCASITDLLAFSIVSSEERWCVMEFACHEVHESSGDWAVYFSSPNEMLAFKHDLERLWNKKMEVDFPLQTMHNIAIRQRCEETSHILSAVWDEVFTDH